MVMSCYAAQLDAQMGVMDIPISGAISNRWRASWFLRLVSVTF
jgi:hypothetical protein